VSVLVIAKIQGDTAKFRQSLADRAEEFAKIADRARSAGGIHHRFGVGDGFVVVADEWESAEHWRCGLRPSGRGEALPWAPMLGAAATVGGHIFQRAR
jgi:hypothetical protein